MALPDAGFDYVAGARVTDPDGVMRGAASGLTFRRQQQRGYLAWVTLSRTRH